MKLEYFGGKPWRLGTHIMYQSAQVTRRAIDIGPFRIVVENETHRKML